MNHKSVSDYAASFAELLEHLRLHLGQSFFKRGVDLNFIVTEKGRTAIEYDDLLFFRDAHSGLPVAARVRGALREFATLGAAAGPDPSRWDWTRVVTGEPALN
jgi:hypothetical protein